MAEREEVRIAHVVAWLDVGVGGHRQGAGVRLPLGNDALEAGELGPTDDHESGLGELHGAFAVPVQRCGESGLGFSARNVLIGAGQVEGRADVRSLLSSPALRRDRTRTPNQDGFDRDP